MLHPLIPTDAYTSLLRGLLLLYACLLNLTYPRYAFIRFFIAPAAVWYFGRFALLIATDGPSRSIVAGMTTVGCYGVMRILEHTLIHLWEDVAPRWTRRFEGSTVSPVHVFPVTLWQRLFYSFDLLTSQRGLSWDAGLIWEWCPRRLRGWKAKNRRQFGFRSLGTIFTSALVMDVCEATIKSPYWHRGPDRQKLTDLPLLQQLVYTFCVGVGTAMSITFYYEIIATACVVCGSNPEAWPPIVDSPFSATSLQDFWSRRWHLMFRRVFERLSLPFIRLIEWLIGKKDGPYITTIRVFGFFMISTFLHLVIMYEVMVWDFYNGKGKNAPFFWDLDVVLFFMAQPFGLLIETFVVQRAVFKVFPNETAYTGLSSLSEYEIISTQEGSESLSIDHKQSHIQDPATVHSMAIPPNVLWKREALTRVYVWFFLLWTGRWWTEKWMSVGLLDSDEKLAPLSVLQLIGLS